MPSTHMGDVFFYGANSQNANHDWVYQLRIFGSRPAIDIAAGTVVGNAPAGTPESTGCYIRYHQTTSSAAAEVEVVSTGC